MTSKSKLVKPPQWWKHLKWYKRVFWKRERTAYAKQIKRGE